MIKEATIEDLKQIEQIEKECFPILEAASKEALEERIITFKDCFYVYVLDRRIIGFINGCVCDDSTIQDIAYEDIKYHREQGIYQTVFGLDVLPEYRHSGIAKELMMAFINSAKRRHKKGIVLTCKHELIGFYEQFGYINQGISKSTHGQVIWYDMFLPLNA